MERNERGEFVAPFKGGRMDGWGRGMDNRRANHDLPADVLRLVVNGDMLTSGRVRRRRGITQRVAGLGMHSVFGTPNFLYWGTASELKRCDANYSTATLVSSARFNAPLSYVYHLGKLYFSNKNINGKITEAGVYESWALPTPTVTPTVANYDDVSEVDVLRRYNVAFTYVQKVSGVDVDESGLSPVTSVTGSDAGVMLVSGLSHTITDSRISHIRIYVTSAMGTEFFAQVDVPFGENSAFVSAPFGRGKKLSTQHLAPMPVGQLIEYYNGRMYVASGNILYYSEPLRYGYYHTAHGFLMFEDRITLLRAADNGLFISADQTYFMEGTPEKDKLSRTVVLPYRAIEGASCVVPNTKDVMWLSERGMVVGGADGKVTNVTENRIAMGEMNSACLGIFEHNGHRAAVAIAPETVASPLESDDYADAEASRLDDLA
jgi:hypothetical protein